MTKKELIAKIIYFKICGYEPTMCKEGMTWLVDYGIILKEVQLSADFELRPWYENIYRLDLKLPGSGWIDYPIIYFTSRTAI